MAAISIIQTLREKPFPKKWMLRIFSVFLLWAIYQAWEDQYEKAQAASALADGYLHQTQQYWETVNADRIEIQDLRKSEVVTNFVKPTQWLFRLKYIQMDPPNTTAPVYPFRIEATVNGQMESFPQGMFAFSKMTNSIKEGEYYVIRKIEDDNTLQFFLLKRDFTGRPVDASDTNMVASITAPISFSLSDLPLVATNIMQLPFPFSGRLLDVVYEITNR